MSHAKKKKKKYVEYQAVISLTQKQIRKYTKEPLGKFFFGWCFLDFQVMPCDFVCPTNTQIDKYK